MGEKDMNFVYNAKELTDMAKALYQEEREIHRLDGWFLAKETEMQHDAEYAVLDPEVKKAYLLCEVLKSIPLTLSKNAIFVGTQRDAFAKKLCFNCAGRKTTGRVLQSGGRCFKRG